MNLNTLVQAYFKGREEDFWAWEEVHRAVDSDLNTGWNMILLLLGEAASEDDIGRVAAGPLEDLIDRYGHEAIDLVEKECKSNSQLRVSLSTVGVLFYYDEFERWYGLLHSHGLRADRAADGAIVGNVMSIMNSYLSENIDIYDYANRITQLLDKPFDDKIAQRILQGARFDVEVLDSKRPPDYREPYITQAELKTHVKQAIAALEDLGYQNNGGG